MKHPMLEYLKETGAYGDRFPMIFCPGCGIGQALNYTLLIAALRPTDWLGRA